MKNALSAALLNVVLITNMYGQSGTNVTYVPNPGDPTSATRPAAYPPGSGVQGCDPEEKSGQTATEAQW